MIVPEVAAALIGGLSSVAASGASAAAAATANRRAFKWSKKYFNYQNEYNLTHYSPAANMQRLRDAGINPHEVAGSPGSGVSLQGSMSVPDYQNPVDPLAKSLPQAIEQAFDIYARKKAIDNQTELTKSQIQKNTADAAMKNYQTANILPHEAVFAKNRSSLPLYQAQAYGLQARKMMQDISLFSMQKQKFQLALDLMEIEKEYQEEYYKYRNQSVKYQAQNYKNQANISALDYKNYVSSGLRPQDPYYARIVGNTVDHVQKKGIKGLWQNFKDWWENPFQ